MPASIKTKQKNSKGASRKPLTEQTTQNKSLFDIIEDVENTDLSKLGTEDVTEPELPVNENEEDDNENKISEDEASTEANMDDKKEVTEEGEEDNEGEKPVTEEEGAEDKDEVTPEDEASKDLLTEPSEVAEEDGEVDPRQSKIDEVMKKVTQMDEEELNTLHGEIVQASEPEETMQSVNDVKKGSDQVGKAMAPVAHGVTEEDEEGEKPVTEEDAEDKECDEVTEGEEDKDGEKPVTEEDEADSDEEQAVTEEEDDEKKDEDEVTEDENLDPDVEALVKSESTLSPGFRDRAKVIFEAAVTARVRKARKNLHESYRALLNRKSETNMAKLTEQVDRYLTHVAESWLKENRVAVRSSLKTNLTESFMKNMKSVFAEHYFEIPAGKGKLVEDLQKKNTQLTEQVNYGMKAQKTLTEQVEKFSRKQIIHEASKGLTLTESVKLTELTKDVKFASSTEFQKKVATIRESYFGPSKRKSQSSGSPAALANGKTTGEYLSSGTGNREIIVEGDNGISVDTDHEMDSYLNAISRVERNHPSGN